MFPEHYCTEGHQGIENWGVTVIDQVEDLDSLRNKELYWINRFNTWAPNNLNAREVYELQLSIKSMKTFFKKAKNLHSHTHENVFLKSDIAVIELIF